MKIDGLLHELNERNGSDLHLKAGRPPLMRIAGDLVPTDHDALSEDDVKELAFEIMPASLEGRVEKELEADFAYLIEDTARFRVNVFYQRGQMGAVLRLIPLSIPSFQELRLPEALADLSLNTQGLVLFTGPTGSGKSTSMAAMIEHINQNRYKHIVAIEDPIEFVYSDKKATINQRELGIDTWSFDEALKHVLRQDPDIILMGEMRDQTTMEFALHAAETGHLVFSTLHTNDCKQTLDRILDTFPPDSAQLIQSALSQTLLAVISQRLLRRADGDGRVVAVEVMINSPTIAQLVAAGRIDDIEHAMARSTEYYGMQTFNQALAELVMKGLVTEKDAMEISTNPGDLRLLIKGFASGAESIDQLRAEGDEIVLEEIEGDDQGRTKTDTQAASKRSKVSRGFEL